MTKQRRKEGRVPPPIAEVPSNNPLVTWLALIALGLLVLSSIGIAIVGIFVYSVSLWNSLGYAGFCIFLTIWLMCWIKWEVIPGSSKYPGDTRRDKHPFSYWGNIAFILFLVFMLERFYILHCMLEPYTSR